MAKDEKNEEPQAQAGATGQGDEQQRSTLRLRYDKAETSYANIAIVTSMPEEVVMNFGVNAMPPTPQREVNIEISNRLIMNYASAKRLAITLGNVIQRYEAANGVINVQTPQQQAQQATVAGPGAATPAPEEKK